MNQSHTRPLREGSLFTGTNGIGLALETMGLDVALEWVCDPDPGATALLDYHYPDVKNLGDITAVDWTTVPEVDILTGGFPCQDISNAGKREGITGARSSLWKHYVRAIRVLRPHYVFVENVAVLRTRGLDVVLEDLAALGFHAEWCALRASDVGAPHQRNRFFLVAADATRERLDRSRHLRSGGGAEHSDGGLVAPHAARDGRHQRRAEPTGIVGRSDHAVGGTPLAVAPHADRGRLAGNPERDRGTEAGLQASQRVDSVRHLLEWGQYAPAVERWERITGQPAPAPTVPGRTGNRTLNPALCEWMMGLPTGWITDVPGLTRTQQLKLAGNGVVVHQAAVAFAHLLERLDAQ